MILIEISIPGRGKVKIENIAFDYNGTLATDGVMKQSTKDKIIELKKFLKIYILTADTYGTVKEESAELGIVIETFPNDKAGEFKGKIIKELGVCNTICVGNGFNDIIMFKESALSIGVIGEEGCNGKLITLADIVVNSIDNVFEILSKPDRIKATLRS